MSFVLDALKRSEQDRNQGEMPNFLDNGNLVHLSRPKKQWWPYVLIAVLLVNAAVFLYISIPSDQLASVESVDTNSQSLSSQNSQTNKSSDARPSAVLAGTKELMADSDQTKKMNTDTLLEGPVNRSSQTKKTGEIDWAERERKAKDMIAAHKAKEEQSYPTTDLPLRIDPSSGTGSAMYQNASLASDSEYEMIAPKKSDSRSALAFPEVEETVPVIELVASESDKASSYEDVRFLYELDARSRPSVPNLNFNSHIYSQSPSARRVMINNIYLREGQQFMGLEVLEIGEFNIVFEKDGQMFKLPAMRDWNG